MTISSAYIFAKQIKAGTVPPDPITVFTNGTWNQNVVGQYYQPSSANAPETPGVFSSVRTATMADGKSSYDYSTNLYALGSKYQNIYTMNQTNISRSCNTGTSIDQSGCSVFVPLNRLSEQVTQIIVEYRITNAQSFSQITIGGIKLNSNAYEAIADATGTDTTDWATLTVTLPEPQIPAAIEIQSTYGSYEIRKITIQ